MNWMLQQLPSWVWVLFLHGIHACTVKNKNSYFSNANAYILIFAITDFYELISVKSEINIEFICSDIYFYNITDKLQYLLPSASR